MRPLAPAIRPDKIWYWIVVQMMLASIGSGVGLYADSQRICWVGADELRHHQPAKFHRPTPARLALGGDRLALGGDRLALGRIGVCPSTGEPTGQAIRGSGVHRCVATNGPPWACDNGSLD